jgi:sec-independent protein translocase protein TatA
MFVFASILSPGAWILIIVLALILFGPGKLPELGKGLGKALRGFKEEIKDKGDQAAE